MISRSGFLIAFTTLFSLTACVSISEKTQMSPSASLIEADVQSCSVDMLSRNLDDKQSEQSQGLDPDNITFLNWNIFKGNGENWEQDLSSFARDHDLMTIQEATLEQDLTDLLDVHEFNWTMHTAFRFNGAAAGVMNVASTDSLHSCGFRVNEPIIRFPKAALVSYYAIEGTDEKLLVANIHGINFTLGVEVYREQLEKLYDSIAHHDGPMIVAGDFNSWSSERMLQMQSFVDRLALSEIEYEINNKTHVFGNAIDHVFYRQLELLEDRVIQVASSDHNPISVSFRFQ